MTEGKIYPQEVVNRASEIVNLLSDEFFIENEILEIDIGRECANKHLLELLLNKFLKGEDLIFESDDETKKIINEIILETHLQILKDKGLIETYIDDITGEEMVWLSEKGKRIMDYYEKKET